MNKWIILICLCFLVLSYVSVFSDSNVDQRVYNLIKKDGNAKVIVFLKNNIPVTFRKPVTRAETIKYLKKCSDYTFNLAKKDIKFDIKAEKFWLFNGFSINVNKKNLELLSKNKMIRKITPNIKLHLIGAVNSNDPERLEHYTKAYNLYKMNVDKVWKEFGIDGTGVRVGVIDTGLNTNLGFTDGKVLGTKDVSGDNYQDDVTDTHGHGTHVTGTILGGNVSGDLYALIWGMYQKKIGTFEGNIGVAPGSKVLFSKVFGSETATFDDIMEGLQWCIDPDGDPDTNDGAQVINASLGSSESEPDLREPLVNLQKTGTFLCFAAGNSGKICGSPADFPEIFAVGATDSSDNRASFSSIGPTEFDGKKCLKPDVCAPGVKVISYYKDKLMGVDGTSMASPNTTGVIALMLQADPTLTITKIKEILRSTALDLGEKGADNYYGYGRVDAYKAVKKVLENKTIKNMFKERIDTITSLKNNDSVNINDYNRIKELIVKMMIHNSISLTELETVFENNKSNDKNFILNDIIDLYNEYKASL